MTALLKIKRHGITTEKIPVTRIKEATEIVNNLPEDSSLSFIYSTVNDDTKIENTITLRKSNHDSNRIR